MAVLQTLMPDTRICTTAILGPKPVYRFENSKNGCQSLVFDFIELGLICTQCLCFMSQLCLCLYLSQLNGWR